MASSAEELERIKLDRDRFRNELSEAKTDLEMYKKIYDHFVKLKLKGDSLDDIDLEKVKTDVFISDEDQ